MCWVLCCVLCGVVGCCQTAGARTPPIWGLTPHWRAEPQLSSDEEEEAEVCLKTFFAKAVFFAPQTLNGRFDVENLAGKK